jgi:hypothetical protein
MGYWMIWTIVDGGLAFVQTEYFDDDTQGANRSHSSRSVLAIDRNRKTATAVGRLLDHRHVPQLRG